MNRKLEKLTTLEIANRPVLWLAGLVALCAVIYWPGLSGSYLFDDFSNIVNNAPLHVSSLHWRDWTNAAQASPSNELKRPLAMLSFAVNEYCTGNNPFYMKLTNLVIHLINGLLLYALTQELFSIDRQLIRNDLPKDESRLIGFLITAIWLLAPINVSAVLYIVQRMESMAQLFVLLGLWQYLKGRRLHLLGGAGELRSYAAIVLCTSLGILAKETAALLPLYAFIVELTILRFRTRCGSARFRLLTLYFFILAIPGTIGGTIVLLRYLRPDAYALRPFTLDQRLLTELRIICDYIYWTLLPPASTLGFYHDDIPISSGWLSPATTLASAVLLIGLLSLALIMLRRRPLFSVGVFWFFGSHALTATVIPLELVFEHRNYFPSIGLFLALASLLPDIPPSLARLRYPFCLGMIGLFSLVTLAEAEDWSNPIRFAESQSNEHPKSPRAQYELGRALVIASGYKANSPLLPEAFRAFEAAAALPNSSALPDAALILTAEHVHSEVKASWWLQLEQKLRNTPPSAEDVSAISSLLDCHNSGVCTAQPQFMLNAFLAALSHPSKPSALLLRYAEFADTQLKDQALAVRTMAQAVQQSPQRKDYRDYLIRLQAIDSMTKTVRPLPETPDSDSSRQPPRLTTE
jgi:hypothetical protein